MEHVTRGQSSLRTSEASSLRARLQTALVHGGVSVWEVQYPNCQLQIIQGGDLVKNLTGRSVLEPEDIDEPYRTALANTNKLQSQGELDSFTHEIPLRAIDGRTHWIRIMGWRISPLGDPVPHYEGLNIDVTTEKEASLLLEGVMAGAAVGLVTVDEWGLIQSANRFAEDMYGYSSGELAGMKLTLLTPSSTRDIHEASFKRFRETGQFTNLGSKPQESVGLRKDGREFAIEATLSAIQVNDRKLLVASIYDVTDRKESEAALRESEERFQLSMEATRDGIWDWDKETDEAYFSPAYYRMFGYEVGEFPAHFNSWKERLHPDDSENALKINMDCVEGRCETFEVEYRMRTKTGEWRWILARGKSVARDAQGRSLRLVGTNTDITDRKSAELAVREQSNLLAMISENIDEAFWIVDRQSQNILYTNSAVARISADNVDLIGQHLGSSLSTIVEEDRARVLINQTEGYEKGQPYSNEYRVTRPDGSLRWIWSRSFPVHGEDGNVSAFIGVAQDITERKDAERAIRDGERLLQQISSTIDEVFWVAETASGRMTFLSSAFEKLTGLDPEAMKENPMILLDIMPEEDRAVVVRTRAKGFTEGIAYSHEYRLISQDGSLRWIWGRGFPVIEEDGTVKAFIGVAQDISEKKHSEEVLQRTTRALRTLSYANEALIRASDEQKLFDEMCRVIVEQGGYRMAWVGLAENDPDKNIRPVAHSGVEVGYLADANISWADNERGRGPTGTAVREGVVQIVQAFIDDERILPWREQAQRRGYAASVAFPLKVRSGVFGALTIYAREPDAFGGEEVQLLTDLANNLSFGVEALRVRKEREEVEAKFAQAQKLETIGHLTGGLAHDFNNLLMAIQFGTEFARNSVQSGKGADDHFDMVLDATQRGADLVRRLSVFSRQQQLEPKVADPGQLIRQAIKLIRTALPETITLEMPVGDAVSAINVDAGQLENALLNLAINARDAMPDGGSLIIRARDTADGMVEVSVSDSGTGMSPQIQAKALEPFFTTKEVGKGTGLGLSMVYGFVTQSGGSLAIDSEEGKGTSIRMMFPPAAGSLETAVRRRALALDGGLSFGNVVLVDDEMGVRRALEILLKPRCKVLRVAANGPDGMKIVASMDRIDLLISDVILPGGLSGFDLADAVNERHTRAQVLLISGYSTEVQRRHGQEKRYRLLHKPFSPQILMAELSELAATISA